VQIFDRKYRLFGVVNLIDLVVIVAVLVAAFAVYRLVSHNKNAANSGTTNVAYTILVPAQRGVTAKQIKVGDTVYKVTGKPVGTVTAVRVTPALGEVWDQQTGTLKQYQSSIAGDVWIDVAVKGTPSPTGFAVGDLVLHGGQPLPIMTSTYEGDAASITTMTVVGQ